MRCEDTSQISVLLAFRLRYTLLPLLVYAPPVGYGKPQSSLPQNVIVAYGGLPSRDWKLKRCERLEELEHRTTTSKLHVIVRVLRQLSAERNDQA